MNKYTENNTNEIGTDEQFDAFMKWAMTNGSDMFSSAANEYVNGGDESKLYVLSTYYAKEFGLNQSVALNIAKEAAEGIYGFLGGMQIIDTRNANESMNTNMNTINEWSPYPKNNDWRKKIERPRTVPSPSPYDDDNDERGWGLKTNKEKEGDWYKNESRNMNEENWKDAYRASDGKIIQYSRPYQGSKNKNFRIIDAPQPKQRKPYNDFDDGWRDEYADANGKTVAQSRINPITKKREYRRPNNESVTPKTLIRLTESDLHKIVKESVQKILRETHNEWDELASIRWRNRDYHNDIEDAQRVGKKRGEALADWNKRIKNQDNRDKEQS